MSKSKRLTIAVCAFFIMLGFLSGGISLLRDSTEEKRHAQPENVDVFLENENNDEKADVKYTLKIQDGVLVVFNDSDDMRPIIVTDIYASTLRHLDREQLTDGIVVNSEIELQTLLEDFTS